MIAGANWVSSARRAKAAAELVDQLSLTREQAIAKHQHWQITFIPQGAPIATGFRVESCLLPPGSSPTTPCTAAWQTEKTVMFDLGVGLQAPVDSMGFNRLGQFAIRWTEEPEGEEPEDFTISACNTYITGGTVACNPSSSARTIKIRSFSGIVERY